MTKEWTHIRIQKSTCDKVKQFAYLLGISHDAAINELFAERDERNGEADKQGTG